jgi:hypothetical protein
MEESMKLTVCWDIEPYSLVETDRLLGDNYNIHPQGGAISQKTIIFNEIILHKRQFTGLIRTQNIISKGKAVPQHIYEGAGGRGVIAPTHSRPRQQMGVSGQRHAPAALYRRRKDLGYPLYRRLGGPQSRSGHRG